MNTEIKDEGELSPEEMQEKSDEAREAFDELSEGAVDVVNQVARDTLSAIKNHNQIMKVINEGIKKVK